MCEQIVCNKLKCALLEEVDCIFDLVVEVIRA